MKKHNFSRLFKRVKRVTKLTAFADAWQQSCGNVSCEVDVKQLQKISQQGPFIYLGVPVFAYIKAQKEELLNDIEQFAKPSQEASKVHLTYCKKVQERTAAFHITSRNDGFFEVDKKREDGVIEAVNLPLELSVCQFCLELIYPSIFADQAVKYDKNKRREIVNNFNFANFSAQGKQLDPVAFSTSSVLNYHLGKKDWPTFSKDLRIQQKYTCEGCQHDFSHPQHNYYLHVHHINRSHYWNSRSNCKVLCYGCHAEEPNHQFMKYGEYAPTYQEYLKVKNKLEGLSVGHRLAKTITEKFKV